MELFLFASGIGVLLLLAVHLLDYAVKSTRESANDASVIMPDQEAPADDEPLPLETVAHYDRAA
jgi:hypothetical protein